jgi:hypothetical protein
MYPSHITSRRRIHISNSSMRCLTTSVDCCCTLPRMTSCQLAHFFPLSWKDHISHGYHVWHACNSKDQVRVALHLKAMPIPLEADCMKFQPFLGWRPASTTHYNKIITWADSPICKGLRANTLGRFNNSSIIQRI